MKLRTRTKLFGGTLTALVLTAFAFAILVSACSNDGDRALPGSGTQVTIARPNWTTGHFQAQLYETLLERLGYEVSDSDPTQIELSSDEFFEAVALGDADFSANAWFPTARTETPVDGGLTIGDLLTPVGEEMVNGAIQGILIDSGSVDTHAITELAQIAEDPAIAAMYDIDGNGKADVFGCPEDWLCDDIIDEVIASVGGAETIEQVRDDYDENFLAFKRRVQAGKPSLAYTWTPNFTVALLRPGKEVKWLSVGDRVANSARVEMLPNQCTSSPCITGWAPSNIRVIANNEFLEREPAARALFEAVQITPSDVYEQNLEMDRGQDSPEDIKAAVDRWIQNNRALVVDWLAYARSEA